MVEPSSVAENDEDIEARNGEELEKEEEQASASNWLGRWVLMLAIVAFLVVYVAQLWRGAGIVFTVLIAAAAMGVVGIGGMVVRQMLLRTASQERAADILDQMERLREAEEEGYAEEEDL